ncbi:LacI family DNA-binding transcriptional regulator [Paracoccus aerius]|uniref:LacI family DNA-binding transcriptional regulator n=1 Tax=Paracoccus aerius TaxID=1915382 RepID=A0ABS1S992_9RHOB|nr:LacI family DNA-binding transcriptional regulator [Paracoccus aerius]MBL3675306.1 LacI family DNA-binding transcriptional regulator [Paracoccus aerius]GHG20977.1 LacI family transcriptional regulator [Paracoccus aerius]
MTTGDDAGPIIQLGASERLGARPALTARELADLIGVSQSTVSRAFSKGTSVSPKTRAFVLEQAEKLGYRPNVIASFLSRRASSIVGVVTADFTSPVYIDMLDRLSVRMQELDIHPLLFNLQAGAEAGDQLAVLRQYNIETVIVISGRISHMSVARWAADGRKVILMNRDIPDAAIGSVRCDNSASSLVADHLWEIGLRRVAFVGGPESSAVSAEREQAFVRRVAELGMILCGREGGREYSHQSGFDGTRAVMASRPEAILYATDRLAIGGLDALSWSGGLSVPGDVSIVGFDNIDMACWPGIQLTTVHHDVPRIVDGAIELLQQIQNGREGPRKHLVKGGLVVRATTGPAKA